jgi:hypothetical protein
MSNVVYVSKSHIERREGPLRIAQLPGESRTIHSDGCHENVTVVVEKA